MAIITPSAVISEIRGSVGTQTFSKNHHRPYVKLRKAPTMPGSVFQDHARENLAAFVQEWQLLTDAGRLAWNEISDQFLAHSRLGKQSKLSGYNAFIRGWINKDYAVSSGAPLPVVSGNCPRITSLTSTFSTAGLTLTFVIDNNNSRFHWVFRTSKFVSPGMMSVNSIPFYYIKGGAFTGTSNSPSVSTAFNFRFPGIGSSSGKKLFLELFLVDQLNGVAFPPVYTSGIMS